jgi:hypothetical protein
MSIVYPSTTTAAEKKLVPLTTVEFKQPVVAYGTSPSYLTTLFFPPSNFYSLPDGRYEIYFVASATGSGGSPTGSIGVPGLFNAIIPFRDPFSIGSATITSCKVSDFTIGYDSTDFTDSTPTQKGLSIPLYASGSSSNVTCSFYQAYMIKQS